MRSHTLTSADITKRRPKIAFMPIGAHEQHSDHLPLATDAVIASLIAEALAEAYNGAALPPVHYGCSHEHEGLGTVWNGTVSISASTLIALVGDLYQSLRLAGVERVVLISGHGGNYVLANIVQETNRQPGSASMMLYPTAADWEDARRHAALTTTAHTDMHAGEQETSLLLHARPDLVGPTYTDRDHVSDDRRHLLLGGVDRYTTSGAIGSPSYATARKGSLLIDSLVQGFANHLEASQ